VWEGKVCVPPRRCSAMTILDFSAGPVHSWGAYGAFKVRINQLPFTRGAFPQLHTLNLQKTLVCSLKPLQHCPQLRTLRCEFTPVDSLDGLQGCPHLTHLECQFTSVWSLAPLRGCTALQHLRCNHTKVASVAPLQACTELRSLVLSHCRVQTLHGLEACAKLQTVLCRMWSAQVASLQPLHSPVLHEVDMTVESSYCSPGRGITSIEPLLLCTQLRALRLLGHCVQDLAALPPCEYVQCHVQRKEDAGPLGRPPASWVPDRGRFILAAGQDPPRGEDPPP
jgi:hypothetical protein